MPQATVIVIYSKQKQRAILAELGIPPERAAVTLDAAKEALLLVMPGGQKTGAMFGGSVEGGNDSVPQDGQESAAGVARRGQDSAYPERD